MVVKHGNFFDNSPLYDIICVTTNGVVRDKELVMGGGIALAFKQRYSFLPSFFGDLVSRQGNHVYLNEEFRIASFPTKDHYKDPSTLSLIEQSAQEIAIIARALDIQSILIPAPGCGLGGLKFEEVEPILSKYLDDRFTVNV